MSLTISRATITDVKNILLILTSCADGLSQQGMPHWNGAHTTENVKNRIVENEVYVVRENNEALGTMTLSKNPQSYYQEQDKLFWKASNAAAMYISKLAVRPECQGLGIASALLRFAEESSAQRSISFIRLDAVSYYDALTRFYIQRGYSLVGRRMVGKNESNFFEKEI